MWPLLTLFAALQGAATPPPVVAIHGAEIYSDTKQNVSVRFAATPFGTVLFSADLPAGWSFGISIDGNQDGKWGMARGDAGFSVMSSPDHAYGQDSTNGAFCSQYIASSQADDPTSIYMSSGCGGLKSDGRVIMTGFDSAERYRLIYEIPADEIFGALQTAHIEVCVWDTKRSNCQHRLPALLKIDREMRPEAR